MIVFSGLDGAGKSTQIELLKFYFKNSGVPVISFWSRGGYTAGMEFVKKIMRLLNINSIPKKSGNSAKRRKSFSKSYIRKIWLYLAIFDLIIMYVIYLRVINFFGIKLLCDRYIMDTLIDFKLNFPQEDFERWWAWKFLLFFAIKPKHHFVFTIPVSESLKRSMQKNEPFPDSEEVLNKRLNLYLNQIKINDNAVHMDCTLTKRQIHSLLLKIITV